MGVCQSSSVHLGLAEATVCCTSPDSSCLLTCDFEDLDLLSNKTVDPAIASVGLPGATIGEKQDTTKPKGLLSPSAIALSLN